MKTAIVCFAAALTCSCRQLDDGSYSRGVDPATRDAEIRRIVKGYFTDYTGHEFEIKGPQTLSQVQRDLVEGGADEAEKTEREEPLLSEHPDWKEFVRKYRQGDEIYYFKSDKRSWAELHGIEGYVIVRDGRITSVLVTQVN